MAFPSTTSCKEPAVGLLLDLGSPFNLVDKPTSDCMTEADNGSSTSSYRSESGSGMISPTDGILGNMNSTDISTKVVASQYSSTGDDTQESTRGSSMDSANTGSDQEPAHWGDLADEHLIDSEKFDFDLPVSPLGCAKGERGVDEEDEVFFGPVGFTETCIATKTQLSRRSPIDCRPLSPMNTEQYLELFLEANKVALELASQHKKKSEEDEQIDATFTSEIQSDSTTVQQLGKKDTFVESFPEKIELKNYKRLVRREMRSPRRGTYTISVSPAGTPPPVHLPSADVCVAELTKDKPNVIEFTAAPAGDHQEKPTVSGLVKSKLPVKRRSRLLMRGELKTTTSPTKRAGITDTDKLVRREHGSPPKRKRLTSLDSEAVTTSVSRSLASGLGETPIPPGGIPKGKRPQPGSFQTKASGTPAKNTKTAAPMTKPSLLQERIKVQANRPLKLAKPCQRGSLQPTTKPQPLKAVTSAVSGAAEGSKLNGTEALIGAVSTNGAARIPSKEWATAAGAGTPRTATAKVNCRRTPGQGTPSTPMHLATKKVIPKRLLSCGEPVGKTTARSLSASSVVTPQSKLPPSTPRCDKVSRPVCGSIGSSRKLSGIPTPLRRLSSARKSISGLTNSSPMRFPGSRSKPTRQSSPALDRSNTKAVEGAIIKLDLSDIDTSPTADKQVDGVKPAVLTAKTNRFGDDRPESLVDLHIDFNNQDMPDEKVLMNLGNTRSDKENLINLL